MSSIFNHKIRLEKGRKEEGGGNRGGGYIFFYPDGFGQRFIWKAVSVLKRVSKKSAF